MGFLVAVLMSFFSVYLLSENLKASFTDLKNLREFYESSMNILPLSVEPPEEVYEKEIETALLKACQLGKSWILRCQECFLETGNVNLCPYPTVSFCQTALFQNPDDGVLLWSFLPNQEGNLSDIWDALSLNPSSMVNVNQIPLGIRWIIRNTYPLSDWINYRYIRPSVNGGDPCGVSEIVAR